MLRNAALLLALSGTVFGCSDSGISGIAPPPSPPPRPALAVTSVSPDYAFASSADITVTITGSAFQPFSIQGYSQALWAGGPRERGAAQNHFRQRHAADREGPL